MYLPCTLQKIYFQILEFLKNTLHISVFVQISNSKKLLPQDNFSYLADEGV